jgi:cyanophycinase
MGKRFSMAAQLFALAVAISVGAAARGAEPVKGSLVIAGGALREDNAQVWTRIVELAGGPGARIAVFATAAGNPERSGRNAATYLERYGARPFVVPVAPRLRGSDARRAADDPAIAAAVRGATGAFFTGGDQDRITGALLHPDGSHTAVLEALWDVYRRGGVIAGTSAGAAIMSSTMFDRTRPIIPTLQDGIVDGADIAPGLGFIGDDVFIDQHFIVRGRFARMLPALLARRYKTGIGIDENTALVVGPDRELSVIGYKGVLLIEMGQATTDAALSAKGAGFNVSNARISYLDSGDRYSLASATITPGADKEPVDTSQPSYHGPLFAPDILGNTAVVNLLDKLADSDQARAVGLAWGAAGLAHPERGFEFTFTKVPESRGYESNRSEAYSVYRIRLDVRPVRVRQPVYTSE